MTHHSQGDSSINSGVKPEITPGILYVVATPIGNKDDMVPRAVSTLQSVDLIAAEDTRHSGKLLQHFSITTPMVAYHDHSQEERIQQLLGCLLAGESIALISDAGTPLISDPGYPLVRQAREEGITVVPIPGASALIAALSVSGLPCHRFSFEGFLPAKKSARRNTLNSLLREERTLIFYESTHRIVESLQDIANTFGERPMVLARELTKTYETIINGTADTLLNLLTEDTHQQRGEFVLIIEGYISSEDDLPDEALVLMKTLLDEGLPLKQASAIVAKVTGAKKRDLYQWAIESK